MVTAVEEVGERAYAVAVADCCGKVRVEMK